MTRQFGGALVEQVSVAAQLVADSAALELGTPETDAAAPLALHPDSEAPVAGSGANASAGEEGKEPGGLQAGFVRICGRCIAHESIVAGVEGLGGFDYVTGRRLWSELSRQLGINVKVHPNAGATLKREYLSILGLLDICGHRIAHESIAAGVEGLGGFDYITEKKLWGELCRQMGIDDTVGLVKMLSERVVPSLVQLQV